MYDINPPFYILRCDPEIWHTNGRKIKILTEPYSTYHQTIAPKIPLFTNPAVKGTQTALFVLRINILGDGPQVLKQFRFYSISQNDQLLQQTLSILTRRYIQCTMPADLTALS